MPTHPRSSGDPPRTQCAAAVFMVRPAAFSANPETAASNRFQGVPSLTSETIHARAVGEFDALARALRIAGVETFVFEDRDEPRCPDAVFPNNWVTLHEDGTVVLYPMLAPSRRRERRMDLLGDLVRRGGFRISRLVDLTGHELEGRFLEGTGSVVFDHVGRLAYACISPRTDAGVLDELAAEIGYETVVFHACDRRGDPVYHTNVLLSIGRRYAIVCDSAIAAPDRTSVLARLAASGRTVITVDQQAMADFACNALELSPPEGATVLAMSQCAIDGMAPAALRELERCVGHIVTATIPTIEACGGGSVRCMLAEVFLPR